MKDFRDDAVQKALDKSVQPYRPERTRRQRNFRILVIVALTLVTVIAFWVLLHVSSPKKAPRTPERKAIPIELLGAPEKR